MPAFERQGTTARQPPSVQHMACIYSRSLDGARGCFAAHQLSCAMLLNAVPPAEPGDLSRVSQMRLDFDGLGPPS